MSDHRPFSAIDATEVPPRTKPSNYPEPYANRMAPAPGGGFRQAHGGDARGLGPLGKVSGQLERRGGHRGSAPRCATKPSHAAHWLE